MRKVCFLLLPLLLNLVMASCSSQSNQTWVTPSINPDMLSSVPLTLEMLKNAEYQAQNGTVQVKLVDGKYESGSGIDYLSVKMLDQTDSGDLNSDGNQDAAIILVENYGGSGEFEYLVPVFNNSGAPLPSSGYLLGDRVAVNSLKIADGRITLDMMVQAPNDPFCCPSQAMTQSFKFYWGPGLVQVHATSGTPAGGVREIVIESPEESDKVTSHIQLTGNVSISPFENTLIVRIMDVNNNQIYQGPIMVSAPDMGAPGNFYAKVDISDSPVSSGMIRIEIVDISMADGSILAMDSVEVILK